MTVSFTGVSNIQILKKPPIFERIIDTNTAEQIIRKKDEIKLNFKLTNDKEGNDIDKFNDAVEKGLALKGEMIKNTSKPADISIWIKHYSYPQEELKPEETKFQINKTLVPLNKNTDLAAYSYMGQLTREMTKRTDLSQQQKDYLTKINSYISDEAVKYIER